MRLYSKCIYTIVDDDALLGANGGSSSSAPIPEGKKWVTAKKWLQAADALGERVPIVLASATCVDRWLGWALLNDVDVKHIETPPSETRYRFQDLRPLRGHSRKDFMLSANDIRPYRLLLTQPFLHQLASSKNEPLLAEWLQEHEAVEHAFDSTFKDADDRGVARDALKQAIAIIDEIAPGNWRTILTPGRIRVFVGSESVIDIGNRLKEFRYWFVPDGEDDNDSDLPLTEYARFFRGPKFRGHIENVRETPLTSLPHADVVLKYLAAEGIGHLHRVQAIAAAVPAHSVAAAKPVTTGVTYAAALRIEGEASVEGFDPRDERDGRRWVLASLVQRQGQGAFRRELLRAYGGQCAITGWKVEDVLEAAHILPYRGAHTNHVSNGLLLRSDLHALFDLHLIEIDPDTFSVLVDPTLATTPYGEMHGRKLRLPIDDTLKPSTDCLRLRAKPSGR